MDNDIYNILVETDDRVRFLDVLKENQATRQGDIYLVRIANKVDGRLKLEELIRQRRPDFRFGPVGEVTRNLQLVADNTIGSRHCIRDEDAGFVTIYQPSLDAHPLEGPVIEAASRFVVTHPEHAAHSLPEGTYQVLYQRDLAFEESVRSRD